MFLFEIVNYSRDRYFNLKNQLPYDENGESSAQVHFSVYSFRQGDVLLPVSKVNSTKWKFSLEILVGLS